MGPMRRKTAGGEGWLPPSENQRHLQPQAFHSSTFPAWVPGRWAGCACSGPRRHVGAPHTRWAVLTKLRFYRCLKLLWMKVWPWSTTQSLRAWLQSMGTTRKAFCYVCLCDHNKHLNLLHKLVVNSWCGRNSTLRDMEELQTQFILILLFRLLKWLSDQLTSLLTWAELCPSPAPQIHMWWSPSLVLDTKYELCPSYHIQDLRMWMYLQIRPLKISFSSNEVVSMDPTPIRLASL